MNLTFLRFQNETNRAKKRLFDYESNEEVNMNALDTFRIDYFLRVVDEALHSLQTRFEQYEEHCNNFDFLFSSTTLQNMSNDDVLKSYKDLDLLLPTPTSRDADCIVIFTLKFCFANNILPVTIFKMWMQHKHLIASKTMNTQLLFQTSALGFLFYRQCQSLASACLKKVLQFKIIKISWNPSCPNCGYTVSRLFQLNMIW